MNRGCSGKFVFLQRMIEIEDKIISLDLFEKRFVCDLNACKGACCVKGDHGAPLTFEEVDALEEELDKIQPYMRPEGIEAVAKTGVFYMDDENQPVTTLVNGGECVFVFFDKNNIAKCAVEEAYNQGKTTFKKPISCHLYPIRVAKLRKHEAINYSKWDICEPACKCGEELNVKVYRFLKEPIIRKWGNNFFEELEKIDKALEERKL
jgi:hypothetical protein